ncbi:CD225/dispanin family protein [Gordonia humi]|uniref:Interferon-induced transmembrane protein n=1 Tax=Gordonia humi TaxID=686429 RepID=A0A840ETD0_9ACTN|nr:CD225/dispanin family protein [Gordonia humi]MBB4134962.1 hypothetical protein [Gordonia humi]
MTSPHEPGGFGQDPYHRDPYAGPNQYGQPQYGQNPYGRPPVGPNPYGRLEPENNLVWGILATIFCCLPLGVVSIVKAASVSRLWAVGDFAGAQQAADDAKKFAIWSAVAAVAVWVVLVIVYVLFFVVLVASTSHT